MTENKYYPRVIVGAYIFNDQGELLLTKQSRYKNRYLPVSGSIEYKETIIEAIKREAREEVNIEIDDIEFIKVDEITDLGAEYQKEKRHLILIDLKARATLCDDIKLNSEATEYKWLKPEEWLKQPDMPKLIKKTIENYLLETNDFESRYKRALADYQNLLKQTAKEKIEFVKYATRNLLHDLIPAYDNLKIAIEHADAKNHDSWLEGVKYVAKQFKQALDNNGVEEIKTVGEKFDHNAMDAIQSEDTNDKKKDGVVAKEIKAGYKLNGKVIMPSRVVVYKLKV